jgi:hypothetical protein
MGSPEGKEGLILPAEPLVHKELIRPSFPNHSKKSKYEIFEDRVLGPGMIPVHPLVIQADFAFTNDFVNEAVLPQVPENIQNDLKIIGQEIGVSFPFSEGISYPSGIRVFEKEHHFTIEKFGSCALDYDAEKEPMWVVLWESFGKHSEAFSYLTYPMDKDKFSEYAFLKRQETLVAYSWMSHNLHNNMEFFLFCRNFAIVFNNLGLEWVAQGKK